eukprot:UN25658
MPTQVPTTSDPTKSPTISEPTEYPSPGPSYSAPSDAPTYSTPTQIPTYGPRTYTFASGASGFVLKGGNNNRCDPSQGKYDILEKDNCMEAGSYFSISNSKVQWQKTDWFTENHVCYIDYAGTLRLDEHHAGKSQYLCQDVPAGGNNPYAKMSTPGESD